ncbi:MAG: hypothetical protein Q7S40_05640 [Opitutaceae bacterium]|nr:hypothetical protein [Opitutaceae bacterium]
MTNDELIAFLKKNPISVGCGIISLALIGGIYFRAGIVPAAEADLAQKTAEADRYSSNIKNAGQLKEQHDTLVGATKEIDGRLVRASQLGVNNQYFFKLESATGAKLVDFRQGGLIAPKGGKAVFSPVAFTVSVQGEIPQLMHFLRLLESGAHYCRVQTATCMAASGTSKRMLTLTLNLELLGLP